MQPLVLGDKEYQMDPYVLLKEGIDGDFEGAEISAAATITKEEEDRILQEIAEHCALLHMLEKYVATTTTTTSNKRVP